jgi:hypothetical protein
VARERLADVLDAATNGDKEECIFIPADRSIPLRRYRAADERMRAARYLKVALVGAGNWGGAIITLVRRSRSDCLWLCQRLLLSAFAQSRPATATAANISSSCATMKPIIPVGAIPEKVSETDLAIVTAGLAKEVEAVNQYADVI